MNTEITLYLIPIAYALTEAYKLFIRKCPASVKAKRWMTAFIPFFAIASSIAMALILSFDLEAILNGLVAGLAAAGVYDNIKHPIHSLQKNKLTTS